jgi:hypothetical protein
MHHESVAFIAVSPQQLPLVPAATVVIEHVTHVLVDRDQIDRRMLGLMTSVSCLLVRRLPKRIVPRSRPWGRLRITIEHDMAMPDMLEPLITKRRITIPVPPMMTPEMARCLSALGTRALRWYAPR